VDLWITHLGPVLGSVVDEVRCLVFLHALSELVIISSTGMFR